MTPTSGDHSSTRFRYIVMGFLQKCSWDNPFLLKLDLPCTTYFPLVKFSSRLVNSIGKMYLVDGLMPIALSVSKYCRVIVF